MRRAGFRWYHEWARHLPYDVIGGAVAIGATGRLSWWSIVIGIGGGLTTAFIVYLYQVTVTSTLIDTGQEHRLALLSGERTEAEIQRSLEVRIILYKLARMVIRRCEDLKLVLAENPRSQSRCAQRLSESFDELEEQYNLVSARDSFRYSSSVEEIRRLLLLDLSPDQLHVRLSPAIEVLCEVVQLEAEWDERQRIAAPRSP